MAYNNQDPAGKALSSMKKEYAIIGKRHIRAWHLWLFAGVLAGAVGAVVFVAKNSAEKPLALQFEKSDAASYGSGDASGGGQLMTILAPNGGGEEWVKSSLQEFRWRWNSTTIGSDKVDVFLAGPVAKGSDPSVVLPRYQISVVSAGAGVQAAVAGVPSTMPTGRYFLGMAVQGNNEVLDWSDGSMSVIDADGLPHIGTAYVAQDSFKAGDAFSVVTRGFKYFSTGGALEILDGNGAVLVKITDSQPGKWVLHWLEEGSFSYIAVDFDPSISRGYAPGVYRFGVRVVRSDGKSSNAAFSSFTVK